MENEYIRALLRPGHHFELPRTQEHTDEDGNTERTVEPMHFEVLQVQYGNARVHTMETYETADDISVTAALAVEVQPETPWGEAPGHDANPDRVQVYPTGEPEWLAPRRIADWHAWSQLLKRFREVEASPVEGSTLLSEPTRALVPYVPSS